MSRISARLFQNCTRSMRVLTNHIRAARGTIFRWPTCQQRKKPSLAKFLQWWCKFLRTKVQLIWRIQSIGKQGIEWQSWINLCLNQIYRRLKSWIYGMSSNSVRSSPGMQQSATTWSLNTSPRIGNSYLKKLYQQLSKAGKSTSTIPKSWY